MVACPLEFGLLSSPGSSSDHSQPTFASRPFLTARWRDLVFLNYEVEPALLGAYVPPGTQLDSHDGRTFASVVAFRFLDTRVLGVAVPGHRHFAEVNLRFYVRREHKAELRRGVVFVRELVPLKAIAAIARIVYGEPYRALPMRSAVTHDPPRVEYGWRVHARWHTLAATTDREAELPPAGSLERFITEHYWGYTARHRRPTLEYRVEHPPWPVRQDVSVTVDADYGAIYPPGLAGVLLRPVSAFVADGSPVAVHRPVEIA